MLKITQQQALKRWDTLPQNLREAIFSELNADILWRICKEQHLSEDKIYKIAALAGDVIMGFIHPEDLAREIKQELGINIEIANSVAIEINRKIFMPIKSEIDKVYAPAAPAEEIEVVDLRQRVAEQKIESENPPITQASAKTIEVKLPETGEAEPIILHREEETRAVWGAKKSLGGLFKFLGKEEKKEEIKPVAAQVEIGGLTAEPLAVSKVESPKVKIVHYTDFRTPIEKPLLPEIKPAVEIPKIEEKKTEPVKIEPDKKENEGVIDLRTFTKM